MMALKLREFTYSKNIFIRCMSTKGSNDYQYMQRSKVPTMHFQDSLPRLPIPKLNDTCDRYLAAQKPLSTPEAYEKTKHDVLRFKCSEGLVLQELLIAKDKKNKHTSYISEPWFDMYVSDRKPIPINYNPAMVLKDDERIKYNDQCLRATNLLISSLRFMRSLREGILEPEVFHLNPTKSDTNTFRKITSMLPTSISWYGAYMFNAYPLDMSQYSKIFNSTRIPQIGKDELFQDTSAKHILVMRNGYFYKVDVLDESGNILPPYVLYSKIKSVLNDDVSATPDPFPIGIFTCEDRNKWAEIRNHMNTLPDNENVFKMIDSSIFNLILDEDEIKNDIPKIVRHFLHGTGKNRWFDKSFSLIITKDGVAGVNFEHSWGDGVAMLRYFQDVYNETIKNPHLHPDTPIDNVVDQKVQRLSFNIDDKVKSSVNEAVKNYTNICDSLDVNFVLQEGVGRKVCKKYSISPDSLMQLGFQAGYYKQNKKFVGSYESASTAAYKHGRTETIRPCTTDTQAYCEKAIGSNLSSEEILKLIINCSNTHKRLTKEAVMGQGFDRHLFALRLMALENKFTRILLFEDPAYPKMNYNIISTSTLSSPAFQAGSFGPVVNDGYGIGYMIMEDALGCIVTNYKNHTDGPDFIECLRDCFNDLRDVLLKENLKK